MPRLHISALSLAVFKQFEPAKTARQSVEEPRRETTEKPPAWRTGIFC